MPYYFTCPSCHQKNYGYKTAPVGTSYFDQLQCARCGMKGIAWVASQNLVGRVGTPSERVAVGAGESPIAYMNPSIATGNLESQVVPRLSGMATLVAPYSQGERGKAFTPNVQAIGEGQCAGQCLHWIRRVLQGGRETYLSPTRKGTVTRTDEELSRKYKKQHMIGAAAQMVLANHKETAPDQKIAELDRKIEQLLTSRGYVRRGGSWSYSYSSESEGQQKEQFLEAVMDKRNQMVDKMNAEGIYSYGWEAIAHDLDSRVNRVGGSSRPFSNIVALRCVNRGSTRFESGTSRSFANAVTGDPEFQAGRAAILSVGLRVGIGESGGSISGHAIAVHFAGPSGLYLFDPNLGIFLSPSPTAMRRALDTLMGPIWADMGWQLDGTFGYAFFRANEMVGNGRPQERVVNFTSDSPTVTTVQNQSIGTIPNVPSRPVTPSPTITNTPVTTPTQQFAPQGPSRNVGRTGARTGGRTGGVSDLINRFGGS
jgi:hypothetical protein